MDILMKFGLICFFTVAAVSRVSKLDINL